MIVCVMMSSYVIARRLIKRAKALNLYLLAALMIPLPVSYTHLDVYKRQVINSVSHGDYSARVGLHTRDEFGELGSQLDEMIDNTVRLMELIRYQSEQKRSYELENLQMQINPHFLYNSLETVCGIIDAGEDKLCLLYTSHMQRMRGWHEWIR